MVTTPERSKRTQRKVVVRRRRWRSKGKRMRMKRWKRRGVGGEEPTSTHVTEAGEEEGEEEVEDDEVAHKDGGHEVGDAGFATGGEEGVGLKTVTDAQLQTDSYR